MYKDRVESVILTEEERYYKAKGVLYAPLGNWDTKFGSSRMKALVAKLVKGS